MLGYLFIIYKCISQKNHLFLSILQWIIMMTTRFLFVVEFQFFDFSIILRIKVWYLIKWFILIFGCSKRSIENNEKSLDIFNYQIFHNQNYCLHIIPFYIDIQITHSNSPPQSTFSEMKHLHTRFQSKPTNEHKTSCLSLATSEIHSPQAKQNYCRMGP